MTIIRRPDTKGMPFKAALKAKVGYLHDLITHNIGYLVPWNDVAEGLSDLTTFIDTTQVKPAPETRELQDTHEALVKWRERAEKAEAALVPGTQESDYKRAAKHWRAQAERSDEDYKSLFQQYRDAEQVIERLQRNEKRLEKKIESYQRVLTLVAPILKACADFVPDVPEELLDVMAKDQCGPLKDITIEQVEVAHGALLGVMPGESLMGAVLQASSAGASSAGASSAAESAGASSATGEGEARNG